MPIRGLVMGLKEVGIFGRRCGCRGFKTSRSLLGPPFLWENMHLEGVWPPMGYWWPPGLFLLPGCLSFCAYLSFSGSWLTLGCHHGIGWANTFAENETCARKEHPPYTWATCAEWVTLLCPPPEASPDWDRRRDNDGVNSSCQTLREMSSDSHQTGAGALSTECWFLLPPAMPLGCGGDKVMGGQSPTMLSQCTHTGMLDVDESCQWLSWGTLPCARFQEKPFLCSLAHPHKEPWEIHTLLCPLHRWVNGGTVWLSHLAKVLQLVK